MNQSEMDKATEITLQSLEIMSKPQVMEATAKLYRRLYQALLDQDFTRDQAIQIVAGVKTVGGGR
jgi:hypothetical protein